jgi:non-canonical (house-cleaning) NTP pyrophosphatase
VTRIVATVTDQPYTVTGVDVPSGVPDTPWDSETKQGATNRAQTLAADVVYAIGLESGLVKRYGDIYEECWACVSHDGRLYYGYSSGLQLPKYVTEKMSALQLEHGPAMRHIRMEKGIDNDKDTWGLYSNYALLRIVSLEEALRNALIQIFAPEGHLY